MIGNALTKIRHRWSLGGFLFPEVLRRVNRGLAFGCVGMATLFLWKLFTGNPDVVLTRISTEETPVSGPSAAIFDIPSRPELSVDEKQIFSRSIFKSPPVNPWTAIPPVGVAGPGDSMDQIRLVGFLPGEPLQAVLENTQQQQTYYDKDASTHTMALPLSTAPKSGIAFSESKLIEALRAVQGRKITYLEFLTRIVDAGIVHYTVFLRGKKVLYVGAKGETYTEPFPGESQL